MSFLSFCSICLLKLNLGYSEKRGIFVQSNYEVIACDNYETVFLQIWRVSRQHCALYKFN